jgi:hypothetical protein
MEWWMWLVIVGVVVIAALVVVAMIQRSKRQQRTAELRTQFGPEYDRVVKGAGGRRKGEAELEQRIRRRRELAISTPTETSAYAREWEELQAQFEETPLPAVARADALTTTVLAERGYPMESFQQRVADLSVDYPDAVEHYRRAHAAYRAADDKGATPEDLYEALQHYRALLEDVVGDGFAAPAGVTGPAGPPQRAPSDDPVLIDGANDR